MPRAARVAIGGAGYAGLSAALELAKHGVDGVVLERCALGGRRALHPIARRPAGGQRASSCVYRGLVFHAGGDSG